MKVTDRRMFTADGRLREEYQELDSASGDSTSGDPAASSSEAPTRAAAEEVAPPPPSTARRGEEHRDSDSAAEPGEGQVGFMDLLGLLAEHASVYLQRGGPGMGMEGAQSLELAKLHIDLLGVLKEKTEGNLSAQESSALDEILYRLRMGFVQVGG